MKTSLLQHLLVTDPSGSRTVLRVPVGIIFAAHGAQKLFGWFGGYGLQGTGHWMASIGLHPGYWMALLAGSAEFFGGLSLIIGLLVRPAAALLAFTMGVAIVHVHLHNGLFLSSNGYEYALTLMAVSTSLLLSGAGRYSVDAAWLRRSHSPHTARKASAEVGIV